MSVSTITQTTPSQSLVDYKRNSTRNSTQATRLQTYDFIDRVLLGHLPLWDTGLLAKFNGKGAPWACHEFDLVTKDFDVQPPSPPTYPPASSDIQRSAFSTPPCCFFASDLATAYPHAKILLNHRPAASWLTSIRASIFTILQWRSWEILQCTDPSFCET